MTTQKYYFLFDRSLMNKYDTKKFPKYSYTEDEILSSSRLAQPEAFLEEKQKSETSGMRHTILIDPSGYVYPGGDFWREYNDDVVRNLNSWIKEQGSDKIDRDTQIRKLKSLILSDAKQYIRKNLIVDQSRISGDKICSLSQEEFDTPVILNVNGRTYSRKHLQEALEKTIYKDKELRLEDVTLRPNMTNPHKHGIFYFENLSMPTKNRNWQLQEIRYKMIKPEDIQWEPFNHDKVILNNLPEVVEVIRLEANVGNDGTVKMDDSWAIYAQKRGLTQEESKDTSIGFRYLHLEKINAFKFHAKSMTGLIVFNNCLFENCIISVTNCWCGFRFKDCQFKNCKLVKIPDGSDHCPMYSSCTRCTYVDCQEVTHLNKDIPWFD